MPDDLEQELEQEQLGQGRDEVTKESGDGQGEKEGEGKEGEGKEVSLEERLTSENRELRGMLREMKRGQVLLQAQVERMSAGRRREVVKNAEGLLDEDDGETPAKAKPAAEEKLTRVEELNHYLSYLDDSRGPMLEILVETMEASPKYADVREVCSRDNFNDLVDTIARDVSREHGLSLEEAKLEVEVQIWSKANPYKFIYEVVKANHPRYAKAEAKAGGKATGQVDVDKSAAELLKRAKAPGSVVAAGSGSDKAGWTSKKIDDLPYDQLDKVPKEVYAKYLAGELD